jgi:quinol monooxygenase YgiN
MMTIENRRNVLRIGVASAILAAGAIGTRAEASERPPQAPAPANARMVTVTVRLSAKDADEMRRYLLGLLPVTRLAGGCRYAHTFQEPDKPTEFLLIQGWDSTEQQQAYIAWRKGRGDVDALVVLLAIPPVIETLALIDA